MNKQTILSAILVFALLSCAKNETNTENINVPLSVRAGISIEPSTKAIITGEEFPDGAKIGVQVIRITDAIYETGASTNAEFTYAFAGTSWSGAAPFYLTATKGKVHAYYPYNSSIGNTTVFTTIPVSVAATANTGTEKDYMYAEPVTEEAKLVSNASGENDVNLTMKHALAQISFYVYKENYSGAGVLTDFSIEDNVTENNKIIVGEASEDNLFMNIETGAITNGIKGKISRTLNSSATLKTDLPSDVSTTLRNQVNASTLVVPVSEILANDIKFTFTIDGKTSSVVNNSSSITSWSAGSQYIYKIKLSGTGLSVTSVSIAPWTTVVGDDLGID